MHIDNVACLATNWLLLLIDFTLYNLTCILVTISKVTYVSEQLKRLLGFIETKKS
jgi:hypothetical protein